MVEYSSLLVLGFAAAIAVFPSLRDSGFFTPKMPVAVTRDSAGHQHKHFKKLCLRFPNAAGCNGGQPPFLPSDEKVPDAHYQAVIPNCQYTPSQDMSRNGASPFVFRFDDITVRGRLLPLECYGPSVKNLVMMLGEDNLLFNDFVAAVNMTTSSPRKVVYYQGAAYQYNVYGYPPFRDWIDAINFIQYDIVNWIPLENMQLEHLNASKSMYIRLTQHYFIFKQPPMQKWQTTLYPHPEGQMPPLSQWMRDLTNEWGSFLNDDASLPPIAMQYMWDSDADSVAKGYPPAKQFKLNDYKASPGGYHSYNQWFGRGVKSGKRPISAPTDDRVLVRPCDSTWVGQWDITEDGCVGLTDEDINGPDQLLQVQRDSKHKKHAKVHSGHHIFGNHFHKKLRAKNKHVEQCMNNPKIKARGAIKSTYYYSVQTLLRDAIKVNSSWATAFNGGIFMHMFLNVNDYHRLHVPVRGRVLYNGFTSENVYLDVCVLPESTDQYVPPPWGLPPGTNPPNICPLNQMSGLSRQDSMHVFGVSAEEFSQVDPPDFTGYQFYQSRGVVIIDSPIGLVATVPMGMAQVSMVNQTADVGDCVRKGDEFSYFGIGGSDMVILVQPSSQFKTDSSRLGHLLQGEWFATATVDPAAQARLGDCGLG